MTRQILPAGIVATSIRRVTLSPLKATKRRFDFGVRCELATFGLRETFLHAGQIGSINYFRFVVVAGHRVRIRRSVSKESDHCEHSRSFRRERGASPVPAGEVDPVGWRSARHYDQIGFYV
jgi:hypothetical protein